MAALKLSGGRESMRVVLVAMAILATACNIDLKDHPPAEANPANESPAPAQPFVEPLPDPIHREPLPDSMPLPMGDLPLGPVYIGGPNQPSGEPGMDPAPGTPVQPEGGEGETPEADPQPGPRDRLPACEREGGYDEVCHEARERAREDDHGRYHALCLRPGDYDWLCHDAMEAEGEEALYQDCQGVEGYDRGCHEDALRRDEEDEGVRYGPCFNLDAPWGGYDWACHDLAELERGFPECNNEQGYDMECHHARRAVDDPDWFVGCMMPDFYDWQCHDDQVFERGERIHRDCMAAEYDWGCHQNYERARDERRYSGCYDDQGHYDLGCHDASRERGDSNLQYVPCRFEGGYDMECHHARWDAEDDRYYPDCMGEEDYDPWCHHDRQDQGDPGWRHLGCEENGEYNWVCHAGRTPRSYPACQGEQGYDWECHGFKEDDENRKFRHEACKQGASYDWQCHVDHGGDDAFYEACEGEAGYDWECHDGKRARGEAHKYKACKTPQGYDQACHEAREGVAEDPPGDGAPPGR